MKLLRAALSLMYFCLFPVKDARPHLVVHIGGLTRPLLSQEDCHPRYWGDNLEYACRCHLIRERYNVGLLSHKKAREIIKRIRNKGHCPFSMLKSIAHKEGIDKPSFKKVLHAVIHSALTVPTIKVDNHFVSKEESLLKEEDLPDFLSLVVKTHPVASMAPLREPQECLHVQRLKNLPDREARQTFALTLNPTCQNLIKEQEKKEDCCLGFLLKETDDHTEKVQNLIEIMESPLRKRDVAYSSEKGKLRLSFFIGKFTYQVHGKRHRLTIIYPPLGTSFAEEVKRFQEIYHQHTHLTHEAYKTAQEKLERLFYLLGNQLSEFHQEFMEPSSHGLGKTYTHGNLQLYNIFITAHEQITLADTESLYDALKDKRDIGTDILHLYIALASTLGNSQHQEKIPDALWHKLILPTFLKGYIHAFPADKRPFILKEIYKIFMILPPDPLLLKKIKNMNLGQINSHKHRYLKPILRDLSHSLK